MLRHILNLDLDWVKEETRLFAERIVASKKIFNAYKIVLVEWLH